MGSSKKGNERIMELNPDRSIVMATGHRPGKLGGYGNTERNRLIGFARHALTTLLPTRPSLVYSGMALGWDQAVAQACIDEQIPFDACVPFHGAHLKWPAPAQRIFLDLLGQARFVFFVSEGGYEEWKMEARNAFMVEQLPPMGVALALWDGSPSGTGNCVELATKSGKSVVNVWEEWTRWNQ